LVINCRDSKDIAKNYTKTELHHWTRFAKNTTGTNVLMMCAPTWFDLHSLSCVNKEIKIFNRKLYKFMKTFQHVQICDISLIKKQYVTHGVYMNTSGKDWITNLWAKQIKQLFSILNKLHWLSWPGRKGTAELKNA
jgi:hypothetical protein